MEPSPTSSSELLTDAQMQAFIRDGYLVFRPEMPPAFHDNVFRSLEELQDTNAIGNNLMPSLPTLRHLLTHSQIDGALQSLLGPDYYLHLHRHAHRGTGGTEAQALHRDSLRNSRFCIDDTRRHHHTRWLLLLYYPQDTPADLGPTGIVARSQYVWPDTEHRVGLDGGAGTVCLLHYDLVHGRAPAAPGERVRHMVKFVVTRMSEPRIPTWDHRDHRWDEAADDERMPMWRHVWDWHRGVPSEPQDDEARTLEAPSLGSLVNTAYRLAAAGAVDALCDGLRATDVPTRTAAAYGLSAAGASAVGPVARMLRAADPGLRARAADVLGDLGLFAGDTIAELAAVLDDDDPIVRRHAVEALGTVGQAVDVAPGEIAIRLSDSDSDVQREAALALARLGPRVATDPSVVPALDRALDDESHYVRGHAAEALSRIGSPASIEAALDYLRVTRWDASASL